MMKIRTFLLIVWSFVAIAQMSGCLSAQNQSTLDMIAEEAAEQFFVEGVIEYSGPHKRWAGPATVAVQVIAREGANAEVAVVPPFLKKKTDEAPTVKDRGLASGSGKLSTGAAREMLGRIGFAVSADEGKSFSGCLSPIRVRLVRTDGSVVEKQGCRGQSAWAGPVSEIASQFISAL